jgi:hypothetical protein
MSNKEVIDYGLLIDEAMQAIVKKALLIVEKQGLPNEHHFYITFDTEFPGVMIPDTLHKRYPEEMTIVLQHQFWDLEVEEERFSVVLSFDNIRHSLVVPFSALTAFADPSVKFGLQFRHAGMVQKSRTEKSDEEATPPAKKGKKGKKDATVTPKDNVVSLDSFRKKD